VNDHNIGTADGATRALLSGGILVAPVFYGMAAVQMALRPEFSLAVLPISYLSLGRLGWIQSLSFILVGALAIAFAIGAWRFLRGGRAGWAAALAVGVYGLGMMLAGMFPPDPAFGFPEGAPLGPPTTMSSSAALHMTGFFTAFLALIVACLVFARRFAVLRARGWVAYSLASAIGAPLLIAASMALPQRGGLIVAASGVVAFGWLSACAVRLLREASGEVARAS
jgi:hypothetical protein